VEKQYAALVNDTGEFEFLLQPFELFGRDVEHLGVVGGEGVERKETVRPDFEPVERLRHHEVQKIVVSFRMNVVISHNRKPRQLEPIESFAHEFIFFRP